MKKLFAVTSGIILAVGSILAFLYWGPLVAWAKNDIAAWHARTTFDIFGYLVDKGTAMLFIVGVMVATVVLFFLIVGIISPDKLSSKPPARPGFPATEPSDLK